MSRQAEVVTSDPGTYYTGLVREAARYMDVVKPGWWANIDPVIFDLECPTYCVCGQNDLDWAEVEYEFYSGPLAAMRSGVSVFAWPELEPLWLEEIARRMPVPDREGVLV